MTHFKRVRMVATGWEKPLVLEEVGDAPPTPGAKQVLVAVEACGVCYRDLIDRSGSYAFLRLPITPGHEAVGRVVAVGPQVTAWAVGDRVGTMHRDRCGECSACLAGQSSLCDRAAFVLGILADGGYATHLVAPESCLYRLPDALPAAEAAVFQCTFGTAYRSLTSGGLAAGHTALITGANGGVGSAAVQIARRLGAQVIAVIREERHRDYVTALGAHRVVVDPGHTFHKASGVGGVDVALECVGQPTFNSTLRTLKLGGRMVVVGNVVPVKAELNLGFVIVKALRLIGSSGATPDDMAAVLRLHAEAPLHMPIAKIFELGQAEEAQRHVKAGGLQGRVVLRCNAW